MKKAITRITACLFILTLMTGSVFAYNRKKEPVSCRPGYVYAESDATSYGKKAYYYIQVPSKSSAAANVNCMAGWEGMYPYTTENSMVVMVGKTSNRTVTQSRTSRFYIKIFSVAFLTTADGYVEVIG